MGTTGADGHDRGRWARENPLGVLPGRRQGQAEIRKDECRRGVKVRLKEFGPAELERPIENIWPFYQVNSTEAH